MPSSTHPEALLISAMIRAQDITTYAHSGLSSVHFHSYADEWRWMERYIAQFRRTPSREAFRAKFRDFPLKMVDDVAHFAAEVKRAHARFMFTNAVEESLDFIERDDPEAAIKVMRSGLDGIESSLDGDSGDFSLLTSSDLVYADVKHRVAQANDTGWSGIPTGFPTLDELTGGAQPGDYWVIGARLGQGKTWTLNQMSVAAILSSHPVLFVTLEQNRNQIMFRLYNLLSSKYGRRVFANTDLVIGKNFSLLEFKRFLDNLKKQTMADINVIDGTRGRVTPAVLAANIERLKPHIVFVDYLTLMDTRDKDWQSVAKLSNDIQQLAIRFEIPIVVAAQINRTGEGKQPPSVNHLGMSDAIGQDADVVITMAQQSPHVVKMRLAKFRNGIGEVFWYAQFDPKKGIYGEISGNDARILIDQDLEED